MVTLGCDIMIYCDASLSSFGFYCLERTIGFHTDITDTVPTCTIFYNEALSILSELMWCLDSKLSPQKLMIYTDLMNTVEMFHSLSALPGYNDILLCTMGLCQD